MSDEKYVSIPFDRWENFYKPIEAELERIRQENYRLKRLKEDEAFEWIKDHSQNTIKQGWMFALYKPLWGEITHGQIYIDSKVIPVLEEEVQRRVNKIPKWIRKIFGV